MCIICALASETFNSTDWYWQGSSATAALLVASAPRQKGLWPSIAASRAVGLEQSSLPRPVVFLCVSSGANANPGHWPDGR